MTLFGLGRALAGPLEAAAVAPGDLALSASFGGSQATSAKAQMTIPSRVSSLAFIDVHRSYPEFSLAVGSSVEVEARRARPVDGVSEFGFGFLIVGILVERGDRNLDFGPILRRNLEDGDVAHFVGVGHREL